MAIIIGDYNRKGGIGKTSSIINIASQFALNGKKVLLIDGDSQINLTQFFFEYDDKVFCDGEIREDVDTLFDVLEENLNIYNSVLKCEFTAKRKFRNKFKKITCKFDFLPGSRDMDYYSGGEEQIDILRKKLTFIGKEYDYIFIDFPPAHNIVTMTYLVACDYVIVPLHLAKNSSLNGYRDVIGRCQEARDTYGNKNLKILGLFYIGTQLYINEQKDLYNDSMEKETKESMKLFKTTIRQAYSSVQLSESEGRPLCICCGSEDITKDYEALVKEMIKRIEKEGRALNG